MREANNPCCWAHHAPSVATMHACAALLLLLVLVLGCSASTAAAAAGPAAAAAAAACASGWPQLPGIGCAKRGGAGAGGWQVPAVDADACCTICTQGESGPGHPKCQAWTYLPYSYHPNGVCLMSATPDCQFVDSPTGTGAVGACDPSNPKCTPPHVPAPPVCQPVERPAAPTPAPLPAGMKKPPHIVSILVRRTPPPLVLASSACLPQSEWLYGCCLRWTIWGSMICARTT